MDAAEESDEDTSDEDDEDDDDHDEEDVEGEGEEAANKISVSEEIQNAVKGIDNAFKEVDMYAIPHPGKKVAKSSEAHQLRVKGTYAHPQKI